MAEQFYKGRTNNHLTWVMVDATDFATPESALSAATKIKIYGKLRGATGVNFVSSGTGSLTNDIQHVGASVLGIYTIALAKADLSDASAAWYDQYVVSLSATGAAYQTIVVDGGIDQSAIFAFSDMISNAYSAAVTGTSRALLAQSFASDAHSAATQANSRVLLVQSRLSDLDSRLASEFSDLYSQVSDFRSDLHSFASTTGVGLHASALSDIRSAIAAGPAATVTASDISDIASAVADALASRLSDTLSAAVQANSRVLLVQSRLSDFDSRMVSDVSDILSAIAEVGGGTVTASDISDIASAVGDILASRLSDILSAAVQTNSRVLLTQSFSSDAHSAAVHAASRVLLVQSRLSDLDSRLVSEFSDVYSALVALSDATSNAYSAAAQGASRALLNQSSASDIYSLLSDLHSDVGVISGVISDVTSGLVVIDDFIDTEVATILAAVDTETAAILALLDNARGEPAQGIPPVNPDMATKVDYLYKSWRNKKSNDGTSTVLFADDGSTADHKQTTAESGGTVTKGEWISGA